MRRITFPSGIGSTVRYPFSFAVSACRFAQFAVTRLIFGFPVIYELKAGGVDERILVGAKLEKLAEGDLGYGSSFSTFDDGSGSNRPPDQAVPQNFQLYSWGTFQHVGDLLPQPEWAVWDQTAEYCAFAYEQCIVMSSLRP